MGSHSMRQRSDEIDAIQAAADAVGQTVDRGWAHGFHQALRDLGWRLDVLEPAADQPTRPTMTKTVVCLFVGALACASALAGFALAITGG